jgi:hypothetical protein
MEALETSADRSMGIDIRSSDREPNEVMRPIHDRLTTVLEPRDYAEYPAFSDRPPIHLLRVLSSDELRATRLEKPRPKLRPKLKADPQVCLFGSE